MSAIKEFYSSGIMKIKVKRYFIIELSKPDYYLYGYTGMELKFTIDLYKALNWFKLIEAETALTYINKKNKPLYGIVYREIEI